jgi:hypothetical protein
MRDELQERLSVVPGAAPLEARCPAPRAASVWLTLLTSCWCKHLVWRRVPTRLELPAREYSRNLVASGQRPFRDASMRWPEARSFAARDRGRQYTEARMRSDAWRLRIEYPP